MNNKAYISFSGGKDSTVLHYLIDEALPGNKIPRVYFNTGIEYKDVLDYVRQLQKTDERIIIYNSNVNIPEMLKEKGTPFKSKEHANILSVYQNSGETLCVRKYIKKEPSTRKITCPKKLMYNFTPEFALKVSDKCCKELKKKPAQRYSKESGRPITITGMRRGEGGQRYKLNCTVFEGTNLYKFHPLSVMENEWMEWYIQYRQIKLCKLYYPPYNFTRTGCKGCPFALDLQHELDIMKELLPNEYKVCENIWKDAYSEYRKAGYRLN